MNTKELKHGWHRVAVPALALTALTIGVAAFAPSGAYTTQDGYAQAIAAQQDETAQAPQQRWGTGPGGAAGYGYGPGMMGGYGPGTPGGGYGYGPGMMRGYGPGVMSGYGPGMMRGYGYGPGATWSGYRHGPGMAYGYGPGSRWGWASLDLSPKQQSKIEQLQQSYLRKQKPLYAELYQALGQLHDLVATEKPDADAVGKAFDQVSATRKKLLLDRIQLRGQIEQTLTPEQRKTLSEMYRWNWGR
ncbi:MAG TPA: Spy/CpxP family protein refolding chaperone [Gammaproteobacteria bacterium]|nr:Spy/CpxP family protein refolding chaperone [Gammaproteobacteria bacterium]